MSAISPVRVQVSGLVRDLRISTLLTHVFCVTHPLTPAFYIVYSYIIYCKMLGTGILYRCACPYQANSDDLDILHSRLGVQTLVSAFFFAPLHLGRSLCHS